ncbi:hypothetical protein [Sporosarcina sp. OR05]|uniref:phage tail protein n=1 Tax=Sporosarcina sp. OR05 TaxID=2969819 RepID=UPI00352AE75B
MELFKLFGSIMVDNEEANKSISKTDEKAGGLGEKLGKGVKTAAVWGAAIGTAAVAAGAGMYKMATSSAETTDRIDKLSQKIGMSRQGFQEFDFIASQSGMSIEGLQMGFKTLVNQMDGVANGNKKSVATFEALGVSVKDSSGNLKDQETVFNEAIVALQGMEEGAEKAKLANDLFGRSGSEMMPMLNGAVGSIEDMKKQAHELGLVLGDDAIDAGVAFTDTMDQLQRSFGTAIAAIGVEFMPMITKFADYIIANMPTIQAVIRTVFDVMSTVISVAVKWLSLVVDAIVGVIETVIKWVQSNSGSMDELKSMFEEKITSIVEFFTSFFALLKSMWDAWGSEIIATLQSIWNLLIPVFQLAFDLVMDLFSVFAALFKGDWEGLWEAIKTLLTNVWDNIVNVIDKALVLIQDVLKLAWGIIQSVIEVALDFIVSIVKGAWKIVSDAFKSALDFISKLTGTNFDSIKNAIDKYMEMAKSIISAVWKYIKNTFQNFLKLIKAIVSGDFKGMWQVIKDQMDNVKDTIKNIWDSVMKFFNGIDLYQIGTDIIQGLINGVKAMATKVVDSVKGVVDGAIDGAKKLLGIKSPSRVFMQIGDDTGQGLINGIGSKVKAVSEAGKKLAGAVIQPIDKFSYDNLPTANSVRPKNHSHDRRIAGNNSTKSTQSIVIQPAPVILEGNVIGEILFDVIDGIGYDKTSAKTYMRGV